MNFFVLAGSILVFGVFSGCALLYRDEIPRDEIEYSVWNAESANSVAQSWHPAGWFVDAAGKYHVYGRREYVSIGYPAGLKSVVWLCVPTDATQVVGTLYEWGYKNGHRIGADDISLLSSREVSVQRDVISESSESKGMLRVRFSGSPEIDVVFPGFLDFVKLPVESK